MPDRPELHFERSVDGSYQDLEAGLRAGPERWLPGFSTAGDRVTGELSYEQAGRRVRRRIQVEIGPAQRFAYGLTVHLRWKAAANSPLYPQLDGHLRLERREPAGGTLRFDARYAPPGGSVGASVDRALMHHVAEGSVADFLDSVAERLTTSTTR